MVERFGAAALVFLFASLTFIAQARACDPRVAGACPDAPITHPGNLVESGGDSAEPARATRASATRKRWRYRKRSARRSRIVVPRRAAPIRAAETEAKKTAAAAAPAPDVALKRIPPFDGGASENTGSFVATSAVAIAAAVNTRSVAPPARPVVAPVPPSTTGTRPAPLDASLLAPPAAPVRTSFVSGKGPKLPVAEVQPTAEPAPAPVVQRASYIGPASAQAAPAAPPAPVASAPSPIADMTVLRAVFLTMIGMLAVGTAVRMVM
jgi:hypothetical protein